MIVHGNVVTSTQRTAGLQAMRGQFCSGSVIHALRAAGVSTKDGFVADVARKLVEHQRSCGRIKRLADGLYQGVRLH